MDPVDPNLQLMWNGEIPWTIDPSSPFFCLPWFYSGSLLVNTTHQIRYCICNGQACDGILRKRCSTGKYQLLSCRLSGAVGSKAREQTRHSIACWYHLGWGWSILDKWTGRAPWSSCNRYVHNVPPKSEFAVPILWRCVLALTFFFVSYLSDPRNSLIWILEWATTCVILIKHLASKSMELETACFGCS